MTKLPVLLQRNKRGYKDEKLYYQENQMKLAIMQPYFFPYIGYFQLIGAVDQFILYDNIKYTKKGWINRNRILQNGRDAIFSLPLKSDSDYLDVCKREVSIDFNPSKLLNQLYGAYQRAPYFEQSFPLLEKIVQYNNLNLFQFLHHSIVKTCQYLGITTVIKVSSSNDIDHNLQNQDKVLALCEVVGADTYVNAIGGMELYSKEKFRQRKIELQFINSCPFEYKQFGASFVPSLSIIDVMMFNSLDTIQACISTNYDLV